LLYHDKAVFNIKYDKYEEACFALIFDFEDRSKNDYMLMLSRVEYIIHDIINNYEVFV